MMLLRKFKNKRLKFVKPITKLTVLLYKNNPYSIYAYI